MALAPFLYDDYYQLKGDGSSITLDLIFGSLGQSPNYTVTLDSNVLIPHRTTSVKNFPLGSDTNINNMVLVITGAIVDMPGTNDVLSLDLNLKGGVHSLVQHYSVTGTTGDHVDISITIRFYQ